jgi:predicted XRE-type DNA-binding protein
MKTGLGKKKGSSSPRKAVNERTVTKSSGNVFKDLDLPDSQELQAKALLTLQIYSQIKALGLTQTAAAKQLNLSQPDVSKLMNGRSTGYSIDRLFHLLMQLDFDIRIFVQKPKSRRRRREASKGRIAVVAA